MGTQRAHRRPAITTRDFMIGGYVAAAAAASWVLPERLWPAYVRGLVRVRETLAPRSTEDLVRRVDSLFDDANIDAAALVRETRANAHLRTLHYLRVHRPGSWRPEVRVEGRERVDAGLAAGRGVILWSSPMIFGDLITKLALAAAGIRMSHLSYYSHGFSMTRIGSRVLNPIATKAEGRFLAERLTMRPGDRYDALRELTRRVRGNRVVSISAVYVRGQRPVDVPLLNRRIRLAAGAVLLARRTGAPLLPVFTVRQEDGSFVTTIEDQIDPAVEDRHEAASAAVTEYVARLERYLRRWPEQYPLFRLARKDVGPT